MENTRKSTAHIMWGGRFSSSPDKIMETINASIDFDQKLAPQDIRASQAHARMLATTKIISKNDCREILQGLNNIEQKIKINDFPFSRSLEDIHMNIEAHLKDMIGESAGRLHTARSRNDQVATDFRLWVRDYIDELDHALRTLQIAFLDQASSHADLIMPGFTHLQNAQPITWGHHMMAYVEMISRDRGRFQDTRKRLNECPLGSAALAGTSFPIDRHMTAQELDFDRPTANSLDSVSDRDFALEFLSSASICAMHLSRLGEELVIWTSMPFQFVKLSDKFTTGSSIMPQKRNPDAAELVRAKVGRILGAQVALTTLMKGLPLAYAKDMQEDKEPLFDAAESLSIAVSALTGIVNDMKPNGSALQAAAKDGFSTATDLADWLVRVLGMPFRKAHHITGTLVKMAEDSQIYLHELPLDIMQSIEPQITEDVFSVLSIEQSVESRNSYGGTSPAQVRIQIQAWRKALA